MPWKFELLIFADLSHLILTWLQVPLNPRVPHKHHIPLFKVECKIRYHLLYTRENIQRKAMIKIRHIYKFMQINLPHSFTEILWTSTSLENHTIQYNSSKEYKDSKTKTIINISQAPNFASTSGSNPTTSNTCSCFHCNQTFPAAGSGSEWEEANFNRNQEHPLNKRRHTKVSRDPAQPDNHQAFQQSCCIGQESLAHHKCQSAKQECSSWQ